MVDHYHFTEDEINTILDELYNRMLTLTGGMGRMLMRSGRKVCNLPDYQRRDYERMEGETKRINEIREKIKEMKIANGLR